MHHLDLRSEGGDHDPERMAACCGAHHVAIHRGMLCIDGCASEGFTFRHADGTPYGGPLQPGRCDAASQALSALQHMGFESTQARALVDAVLHASAVVPSNAATFLHAALRGA